MQHPGLYYWGLAMIYWEEKKEGSLPIISWCAAVEDGALEQARNLARHPAVSLRVVLMPDCHQGFGMPIGGVIAVKDAIIPNAVGVDIGCGMVAVKTDFRLEGENQALLPKSRIRQIMDTIKTRIPLGEGHARKVPIRWDGFELWEDSIMGNEMPGWFSDRSHDLDQRNLGTLGGGNHFIELQRDEEGFLWIMLHSGSRNLGSRIASHYHGLALSQNQAQRIALPSKELAFFYTDSLSGRCYIRDMEFAMSYAQENRRLMMHICKEIIADFIPGISFEEEINIHHNYAKREVHEGREFWIHRKGATSARLGQLGIIPGSMGTPSYIVEGLGNPASFQSCSHGAGRRMGRNEACRRLDPEECNRAMGDVVYDTWKTSNVKEGKKKHLPDLSEAPLAYKNIDEVLESELDLVKPRAKLKPLPVIKG